MKKVQISVFKAKCLQLLDEVSRTDEELIVTRHGQPLVTINPIKEKKFRNGFGLAKGTAKIQGDLIAPATDLSDWEVLS